MTGPAFGPPRNRSPDHTPLRPMTAEPGADAASARGGCSAEVARAVLGTLQTRRGRALRVARNVATDHAGTPLLLLSTSPTIPAISRRTARIPPVRRRGRAGGSACGRAGHPAGAITRSDEPGIASAIWRAIRSPRCTPTSRISTSIGWRSSAATWSPASAASIGCRERAPGPAGAGPCAREADIVAAYERGPSGCDRRLCAGPARVGRDGWRLPGSTPKAATSARPQSGG